MAGSPVPELRETQAHRPCCQALGHFPTLPWGEWGLLELSSSHWPHILGLREMKLGQTLY